MTLAGFEGDKHAGMTRRSDARTPHYRRGTEIRNDRQVSIVSEEELAEIAEAMGVAFLRPEWLGANLLLASVPRLTCLPPNTRLIFPEDAVLVVQGQNHPCRGPGEAIEREVARGNLAGLFPRAAMHRRGLVTCVERPGTVREDDTVTVEVPYQHIYEPVELSTPSSTKGA